MMRLRTWIIMFLILAGIVGIGNSKDKAINTYHRSIEFDRSVPVADNVIIIKKKTSSLAKTNSAIWNQTLKKLNVQGTESVFNNIANDDPIGLSRIVKLHLPASSDVFESATIALEDSSVEWAEPLYVYQLHDQPNDEYLSYQWYLDKIKMPEAWDIYKGTGDIIIGIVDTGIDPTHPDLKPALWENQAELNGTPGFDDDHNGFVDDTWGWDFGEDDNDPSPSTWQNVRQKKQYHGTWSAGIAGSITNNSVGIASPAYNVKLMAIKVPKDDNLDQEFYSDQSALGIKYAADMGAKVINCSFGGGMSQLTHDAVIYAQSKGAIVIASAGNDNVDQASYPASFPEVLSVASTNESDVKAGFSQFHSSIDISAPGVAMFTTSHSEDNGYGSVQGTSFSAPLVASVAALVMDYRPDLTAVQVREQVRVSADPIDNLNLTYAGKLGKGRLNALNALSNDYQSLRMMNVELIESLGNKQDGIFEPGETIDLTFSIINYLVDASGVSVRVAINHPDISIENGQLSIPNMVGLDEWHNRFDPVKIHIDDAAPSGETYFLDVKITTSQGYVQNEVVEIKVIPPYGTIEGGNVALTLSSFGRMGLVDIDIELGRGFEFGSAGSLLFEGAIMAGTHPDSLSDVARGDDESSGQNLDFFPIDGEELDIRIPGEKSAQQAHAIFRDSRATRPMNLQIRQRSYAFDDANNDDYVILAFDLMNVGDSILHDMYFGLYMDWDIGDAAGNKVGFDADNRLAYTIDPSSSVHGGLTVLGDMELTAYREYDNRAELDDGFTDHMKYSGLSGGVNLTSSNESKDFSQLVGVGPITLIPNDTVVVGMAMVGGRNLNHLQQNSIAAQSQWNQLFIETATTDNNRVALDDAYPNPFMVNSTLKYILQEESHVHVSIIDLLGREVVVLLDEMQSKGEKTVSWNGHSETSAVASGVYFYRVKVENDIYVKKCVRLSL